MLIIFQLFIEAQGSYTDLVLNWVLVAYAHEVGEGSEWDVSLQLGPGTIGGDSSGDTWRTS